MDGKGGVTGGTGPVTRTGRQPIKEDYEILVE